jgi:hypothetical protein
MSLSTKRKRGGQPGNHNRLKHGLYARQFPVPRLIQLERMGLNRSEMDIALARVRLKSLLEKQAASGPEDFLPYERAIQYYIELIGRLIHRNACLPAEWGMTSVQLRDLLAMLKE